MKTTTSSSTTTKGKGPFAYVEAINNGTDIPIEKDYSQFLINKALSYFPDCFPFAEYCNQHKMTDIMHFRFLRSVIKPRKRFSRGGWAKPSVSDDLENVRKYYKCSRREAEQYITLLTDQQLLDIKQEIIDAGL